jgi:hypothetical protein
MQGTGKPNLTFAIKFCQLACALLTSCTSKLEIETELIEPFIWRIDCQLKLHDQSKINLDKNQIVEICDLLRVEALQ